MPSIVFRKCECGIEFKIIWETDGRKQTITCECGRQIKIAGTALSVHADVNRTFSNKRNWVKVPLAKVKDVPFSP